MDETVSPAIVAMLEQGQLSELDDNSLPPFTEYTGLSVLLFTGGPKRVREAHDVAVALREVLRDYPGLVRAAVLQTELERDYQEQFRIITPPSLVFISAGKILEVLPGVRDWAEYTRAFSRYLGAPRQEAQA